MEGKENIDQGTGGAGAPDLKSQLGAGGQGVGDDLAGLKSNNAKLLDEKKALAAKVEAFEAAERKRTEEEAKKRGDFETLIKAKDETIAKLTGDNKKLKIENKAQTFGLIDPDYVEIISKQVKDDFSNLDDIMTGLKESKPYLFGAPPQKPDLPPMDKSKGQHQKPGKTLTSSEILNLSDTAYAAWRKEQLENRSGGN